MISSCGEQHHHLSVLQIAFWSTPAIKHEVCACETLLCIFLCVRAYERVHVCLCSDSHFHDLFVTRLCSFHLAFQEEGRRSSVTASVFVQRHTLFLKECV